MEYLLAYFNAERGRRRKLAEALGINFGALSQWKRVPAGRVLDVERFTGISRHLLRADLYPLESSVSADPHTDSLPPRAAE